MELLTLTNHYINLYKFWILKSSYVPISEVLNGKFIRRMRMFIPVIIDPAQYK